LFTTFIPDSEYISYKFVLTNALQTQEESIIIVLISIEHHSLRYIRAS